MPAETPDSYGAYPRLTADQITRLTALGQQRIVPAREHLFHAGDRNCDFYVVLSGTVAVVEADSMAGNRVLSVHGPGRFLGELGLLTGEAAYYGAVALAEAAVLAVPVDRLRELVARDPALGDLILRAYLIRRSLLVALGVGLRIIGSRYSPDARRLRDFAARNRLPAQWLDLEDDVDAESLLKQLGIRPEDTPVVILYGQRVLRNPGNAELAAAIGLPAPMRRHATCELLVVGAGPAGLSAAVYGASDGMQTLVIEGTASGGQAGTSSRIENYLGFPAGISGDELAVRAMLQAEKFGAQFAIPAEATGAELTDGQCTVRLADESSVTGRLLVIATGARYRRPDIPRLEHFEPTSVYYAASQAEALLCRDDPVVIIGGGNSAGQAAVFLSRHAAEITVVTRDGDLAERMSRYLIDQLDRTASIRVLVKSQVRELIGTDTLEAVAVEDQAGMRQVIPARALFIFIGAAPSTPWLGDIVALDQRGFVRTGDDAMRARSEPHASGTWQPSALETSEPGVFAVGDVRSGSTKRVAAAVGEGAMAIRLAFDRLRLFISRRTVMAVMGSTKFERFFREAAQVRVDRDDVKRYLDFVNDVIYDVLLIGQATAKANARDIIEPWDPPITAGLQECMHQFERIDEDIELRPILDSLAAKPPLASALSEETQARLPLLFGGISVALARTFHVLDAELTAVHTDAWDRAFSVVRILI